MRCGCFHLPLGSPLPVDHQRHLNFAKNNPGDHRVFRHIGGVYTVMGALFHKGPGQSNIPERLRAAANRRVAQTAVRSTKVPCCKPNSGPYCSEEQKSVFSPF